MNKLILSIVIPTRNRENLLKMTLESIEKQKADQDTFEVIVIDNGSTDGTKDIAKEYQKKIKQFKYIYDARPGLHVGRNRGLLESRGEIVGYLDDDVILFPNWINTILEVFEDEEVMYVSGSVIPYDMSLLTPEFMSKHGRKKGSYSVVYSISCFWENGVSESDMRVHKARPGMQFGCNSVYRKKVLQACRGFHPDGMPNNLLMYRGDGESYVENYIHEHKMKCMYYAQASVYHMIDVNRVNDEYINYMYFRSGISNMYTSLRKDGVREGVKLLKKDYKWNMLANQYNFCRIKGEMYLLFYYIFYKRIRKWVHKKDYF